MRDGQDKRFEKMLNKRAIHMMKTVFTMAGLLSVAYILLVSGPFYLYFTGGQRPIIVLVLLPFTTFETDWGYLVNLANHMFIGTFSCLINIANDSSLAMITVNMWAGADVIQYSLKNLEDRFRRNGNRTEQIEKLKNVLVQIQDMDRFDGYFFFL